MANFFTKFNKSIKSGLNRFAGILKFTMLSVVAASFNFKNPRLEKSRQNARDQMMGRTTTKYKGRGTAQPHTPEAEILSEVHALDNTYGKGHGRAVLNRIAQKHDIDPSQQQTAIIKQLANKQLMSGSKVDFGQEVFNDIQAHAEKYTPKETEKEAKASKTAAAKVDVGRVSRERTEQIKKQLQKQHPRMSSQNQVVHRQKMQQKEQSSGYSR